MGYHLQIGSLIKGGFYANIESALRDDFLNFAYKASMNIANNALNM
jgi:hypothetical protein